MQNTNDLCMGCMKDIGGAEPCPHCGYRDDHLQLAPYLPPKTWLQDRYLVGKMVSHDGEGATYIGWDNVLQAPVLIREFLPSGMVTRETGVDEVTVKPQFKDTYAKYLNSFLELSRTLGRLRDLPALFPVYDIFELNSTGYRISEQVESINFEDFLRRNGNTLTFEQVRSVMMPLLSTLSSLHAAGIIHGGISPETLFIGRDGRLRIDGFAIPALRDARSELEPRLFEGYSAIEQYGFEGSRGPHTDIYSFAAVIYRALVGNPPPDAPSRATNDRLTIPSDVTKSVPTHALTALANALQVMPDDRTDTVDEFRDGFSSATPISELRNSPVETDDQSDTRKIGLSSEKNADKKRSMTYTLIAMGATVVVLVILFIILNAKFHIFGGTSSYSPSEIDISSGLSYTDSGMTQKVPDVQGMDYNEALTKYGSVYEMTVSGKEYSREYAAGEIIRQSLEAGSEVPADASKKHEMTVVLSLGSSSASIPDVSGCTYEEAFIKLVTAGFSPKNINKVEKYSDSVASGKVIETTPGGGTKDYSVDREITVYVSNRPASQSSVPDVSSQPAASSRPNVIEPSKPDSSHTVSSRPSDTSSAEEEDLD